MTSHQGVGASQATGWVGWIAFGAVMMTVSYTHLTLPTICSV